jgi:predicted HTH transcriptional regulator
MGYTLVFVILACFLALYFLIRERTEIIEWVSEQTSSCNDESRIAIRRRLVKKYLSESRKISINIYRALTGISPEQAEKELEQFANEGFLQKFGETGEVVYYDLNSQYNRQNIYDQINRE